LYTPEAIREAEVAAFSWVVAVKEIEAVPGILQLIIKSSVSLLGVM
jgi:hypothetical protein